MRIVVAGAGLADGRVVATFYDAESRSWQNVDVDTGEPFGRHIATPATPRHATTPSRDVGALFDQILASARVAPPPP